MLLSVTEVERRPMCPAITIYVRVRTIHNGSELWVGPEAQSAVCSTSDSLSLIGMGYCLPNNSSLEVGLWRPRGRSPGTLSQALDAP